MEMHRRLWLARGARGKSEQGDSVPAGYYGIEPNRLAQRHAIELGIVVRGSVKIHNLLEKPAGLCTRDQFVGDAAVGQRKRDLCLVDDLGQLTGTKHRHGVDRDGACFGCGKPCGDQGRIIARAYQDPVAGLDAVIFQQCMRQAIRPVGQLFIGALATVADQRDTITEALLDITVSQLDRGVEIFGILKLRPLKQEFRPLLERRKVSPRKIIDVAGRAKVLDSKTLISKTLISKTLTFKAGTCT